MGISIQNFSFSYSKEKILSNIDIEINEGDFVGILGSNGSGKTSLIYSLNGVIPSIIHGKFKGKVTVDKYNTQNTHTNILSKTVGIVFQDPSLMLFNSTVYDEIAFGIDNMKLTNKDKRIERALSKVNLNNKLKRNPQDLSEGQKQRLCIASVLALGTKYLVLDEPIAHLDYNNSLIIYNLLKKLNLEGKTIITVEHDTDFIWDYCNKVIILNKGKIIKQGDTKEILKDKQFLINNGIKPSYKS